MIKLVIFDIGNVLLNFDHDRMLRQLSEVSQIELEHLFKEVITSGYGIQYEQGLITTAELLDFIRDKSKIKCTDTDLLNAMSDIFEVNHSIIPLLEKIKLPKYLLSNTCEAHMQYALSNYPFLNEFDHAVFSYKVKARKPDKAIFNAALSKANLRPEECFFTDDILEYANAAKDLGLHSHHYQGTEGLENRLKELSLI